MKKYNNPEENPEKDKLEEPVCQYKTQNISLEPCQYTPEEVRQGVRRAVKQFEEGKFYTDDEVDDLILS